MVEAAVVGVGENNDHIALLLYYLVHLKRRVHEFRSLIYALCDGWRIGECAIGLMQR